MLALALYFFILSTVLQTEDAYVEFYESEFPPNTGAARSKASMIFVFGVFATLYYFTLFLAPFLNCTIKTLALGASGIILIKYICSLFVYSKVMTIIFELAELSLDVVGKALFYLTMVRLIQMVCEKHNKN
jgi:antibiotic biosynthesis monooxygenase (ABM) superfamily enzyme